MGVVLGLLFGVGVLLLLDSRRAPAPRTVRRGGWRQRRTEQLRQAGIQGVSAGQLLALEGCAAVLAAFVVLLASGSLVVAAAFAVFGFLAPAAVVRRLRARRTAEMRDVWPEVVDNLASAIRAGMSLPEAVSALGERGPLQLRGAFGRFAADYRASGRFSGCLDRLEDELADPVCDRVCEALRMARGRRQRSRPAAAYALGISAGGRADQSGAGDPAGLDGQRGAARRRRALARAPAVGHPVDHAGRLRQRARSYRPRSRRRGVRDGLPDHVADRAAAGRASGAAVNPTLTGAVLGGASGIGVILALAGAPPLCRPGLEHRLAPYLRDGPGRSRLLAGDDPGAGSPLAVAGRLLGPLADDAGRALDRLVGGARSVRRRLAARGSTQTVDEFRVEQVLWGACGLLVGTLAGGLLSLLAGRVQFLSALLLAGVGALGGVLARDWWLSAPVRRREQALLGELPIVADLLALAVTAGEGPIGAIDRICRMSDGELASDLSGVLAQARTGRPLLEALQALSERTSLEPLSRFVDGLVIAIERGTPLADVLRAQAGDVREAGRRALLESGGRKEIAMMVARASPVRFPA